MNFQIVPVAKFENQLLGERPQRYAYSYIKKKNDFKSERHFFVDIAVYMEKVIKK